MSWSDGVTTATRTDTNVTADKSVTATFAINTYTLTYAAGRPRHHPGTSPQTVNCGACGTPVTAVADTGYHFVSWSDGVLTAARTDAGAANLNVTATFAINTYTLTYTAGAGGTITGTSPQTVNYGSSGTAVTAQPTTGYHFVSWSDGVTHRDPHRHQRHRRTRASRATFASSTYTLTYTAGTGGSIGRGRRPQTVAHGSSGTAVTAIAQHGLPLRELVRRGRSPPPAPTPTSPPTRASRATFAINTYTLTYTAGSGGTISGTSPQAVDHGANGTAVTAVAQHRLPLRELVRRGHHRYPHRHQRHRRQERDAPPSRSTPTRSPTPRAPAARSPARRPQTVNYGGSGTAVTAVAEHRLPLRELVRRGPHRRPHRRQRRGRPERHCHLRDQHLHARPTPPGPAARSRAPARRRSTTAAAAPRSPPSRAPATTS